MNYRHIYHAGNFADVFKHVLLCRMLGYLARKDAPFRVIDTHAGPGLYRLDSEEARKTGEASAGVKRLSRIGFGDEARLLLAPYLDAVAGAIAGEAPIPARRPLQRASPARRTG